MSNTNKDLRVLLPLIETVGVTLSNQIKQFGLSNVKGAAGHRNIHDDVVQKLDVYANDLFVKTLSASPLVNTIASEEMEHEVLVNKDGEYDIFFDPLDGSSNIDVNITIGSIFSVYKRSKSLLQTGDKQIAAGYILYGPSTVLIYATSLEVNTYTLDPTSQGFFLTHKNIQIPSSGEIYSINEGNSLLWDNPTTAFIASLKEKGYKARYVGSLVADVHRTLIKGGVFLYPSDKKNTDGKLRLMYEVSPMSFIVETAGGKAMCGKINALSTTPTSLHQKVPIVLGSMREVEEYKNFTL